MPLDASKPPPKTEVVAQTTAGVFECVTNFVDLLENKYEVSKT